MTHVDVEHLAELHGLIPPEVGAALADLAALVPSDQAIVEVGSFQGKSTCYLAEGAKAGDGAHVYAVDAWDLDGNVTGRFGFAEPATREAFEQQVRSARLWSRVTPRQGFSVDVAADWNGPPVGLLFIDADHHEDNVRADYRAWSPHLAAGAVVVFDDLDTPRNPGVRVVVDELVDELGLDVQVVAGQLAVLSRRG